MTKITRVLAAAAAIILFAQVALAAPRFVPQDPVMPLSQVKPGMTGYAKTVLSGTKISSFKVTIIGVVPRKTDPKNLIVIRVDDKYVRQNGGIAAGMSGSPVYIGGKLIGAIGYGWAFSDNNLGLVTPIEEMTRAMEWPDKIPWFDIPKPAPELPASADAAAPASKDVPPVQSGDKNALALSDDEALSVDETICLSDDKLEKKMMPLAVDGISDRMAARLGRQLGVKVAPMGASAQAAGPVDLKWDPKPGAAMGAALAWGDFTAGGIGTLSAVSKDGKFLAFAHPMFNKGGVAYALMDANIVKIIPSVESSFKLGYLNKITGLVTQDRPQAIGGELGQLAAASSYTLRFKNIDTKETAQKRFQTVADPFVGPEVAATGLLGLVDSLWAQKTEGTALISYSISGGNLTPAWTRRNIFYSDKDVVKSMQKEIDGMGKVMSLNPFREISPYGVEVEVELTKTPRVMFIDKIEITDKKEFYRPGDKLKVDVTFRPWRKQPVVKSFGLTVPENSIAFCEITVRGGGIEEPQQEPLLSGIRSVSTFAELLKELSVKETNNQIIVEISGPEKDAKKKKAKTETAKEKQKSSDAKDLKDDSDKNKKPEPGRAAAQPKKDKKPTFTPEDLLEDRFVSEIRDERVKEGSLVIADTNYYIEGVLRKFIRVKSNVPEEDVIEDEIAQIIAEKENEKAAEAGDEEELPDDGGDEGDGDADGFSILTRTPRAR
ncbi:MAG: SpoIVB peptidase S55 domain-containing protein [Cloacibacillus sp.]